VLVDESTSPEGSSTKIEILMERIINLSGQHKILVFSQFVSMLDLIKERLSNENIGYTYLTGSTQKRERVVDQFQNDPDARVFLISLKAGGTGLNLTAAEYVFLVDPWWNPAIENQAIDRIYRIGQQKNVVAVRLICKDTIEEKIMILQETKTKLASDLLNTGDSPFRSFSKNDFLALANSSTREMAD
jgi:SNF2 family DNA or RNA helicase